MLSRVCHDWFFLIPVSVPGFPVSSPSPYKRPVQRDSADVPICLFVCYSVCTSEVKYSVLGD